VERVIPAPPERIFDLLADPARHHDIDGSGTVRDAAGGSERLALGSKFRMSMKRGISYAMVSEVVEFEENRRIAWQSKPPGSIGARLGGGRIWRYELEPVDGGTRVTETWDISQEAGLGKPLVALGAKKTAKDMEQTLARIEELVAVDGAEEHAAAPESPDRSTTEGAPMSDEQGGAEEVEVITTAVGEDGTVVVDDVTALADEDGNVLATDETIAVEGPDGTVVIDEVIAVADADGELVAIEEDVVVIEDDDT
jgi:uncharacterized protein YndB with AHSA1/START domain